MELVGLVACAGRGSRLGLPFSKEMFPDVSQMHYRPIIMYTIEAMKTAGIQHIIFTVNPQKDDLLSFLGNGRQYGMHFTYCIHPTPRSLPESLDEANHLLENKTVVFAMPDTIIHPRDFVSRMISFHQNHQNEALTLGCFPTNQPYKCGMVEHAHNKVLHIFDKPAVTDLVHTWGAMVWSPRFTDVLHDFVATQANVTDKELILSEALGGLIDDGLVNVCCFESGSYQDLGTYDSIVEWGNASAKYRATRNEDLNVSMN